MTCADGTSFTGSYRPVTTLTDARRHPATALVGLYHQRWEHESAYYALRHTIMNGRSLRPGDPAGTEQEMWSPLTLCQVLRTVMVDAAESLPGTAPDRCCFTVALQAARHRILGLLEEDPSRLWRPRDIAAHFGDITMETMYRQLSRWAETGLIHKLGPGLYAATAWTPAPLA